MAIAPFFYSYNFCLHFPAKSRVNPAGVHHTLHAAEFIGGVGLGQIAGAEYNCGQMEHSRRGYAVRAGAHLE